MIILAVVMIMIALSSLLLFHGNILTGVLMLLCAAGILGVRIFAAKRLKKILCIAVYAACAFVYVLSAFLGSGRMSEYGFDTYGARMNEIYDNLEEEHYRKAISMIQELRQDMGDSDMLRLMEAQAMIENGDTSEALQSLEYMMEKDSAPYYLYRAAAYDKEGNYNTETEILLEGARKNPENALLNYRAGCMAAWREDYQTADYYLYQALTNNYDGNCFAPYMLAHVRYKLGNEQDAYTLMQYAEERGIMDETEYLEDDVVQWYLAKKEVGGNEQ